MSRTLTPEVQAAIDAGQLAALLFVEMDFPSGFVRVNNSPVTYQWNGHEWLGLGDLGSIDPINEGASLEARGLAFRLSGVPTTNIYNALGQKSRGRACRVRVALLDPVTYAVLPDPPLMFKGKMDTMPIKLGSTATITVNVESALVDWGRPRVRRFNHEDQHIDYPADMFFDHLTSVVDKEFRWGY